MSVAEAPRSQGIIQRATNILLHPKAEWDVIAAEPATVQSDLRLCGDPGGDPGGGAGAPWPDAALLLRIACYTPNPVFAVISSVVYYVVSLAGVFVVGLIIDALAPEFRRPEEPGPGDEGGGLQLDRGLARRDLRRRSLVLGVLLSLLGLYSFYLLYVGLPRTMKSPEQQSIGYTVVVIILGIIVFVVGGAIAGTVATMGAIGSGAITTGAAAPIGGTVRLGNGASVDLDKLRAAGQQAEAQLKAQQQGGPQQGRRRRSRAPEGAAARQRRRRGAHRRLGHQRRRGRFRRPRTPRRPIRTATRT